MGPPAGYVPRDGWSLAYGSRLLGPLEVGPRTAPVRIQALKQRTLLAALALHPGRVMPVDILTEALWGDQPPASSAKLLQLYVSHLRKTLPVPDVVVTRQPGYALEVPPGDVDVGHFERLVDAGSHARSVGAPQEAAGLLREALDLWRGDPLPDVGPATLFDAEAARLWELQVRALEDWYAVRLELGESAEVVGSLQALAAGHPLREGLHESLVLALYRSGRQAEALAAYERVRLALRDELGLDPGPALRELHRRLLRQEPELAAAPQQQASRLPMPLTPTIGRERELDQLWRCWTTREPAHHAHRARRQRQDPPCHGRRSAGSGVVRRRSGARGSRGGPRPHSRDDDAGRGLGGARDRARSGCHAGARPAPPRAPRVWTTWSRSSRWAQSSGGCWRWRRD
jgi:DNA-binding SARP family transcriptional activator